MLQVYSKVTQLHIHTFFFRFFSLMKVKSLSRVRLFVTPWTEAHQAPRYMGFSRQEYSSVLPFPSPGDLPDPEIEPRSPALQAILYHLSHQGSLDSIPERTRSFRCGANEAFLKILIYSTALGLSRGMWIFSCSIWDLVP